MAQQALNKLRREFSVYQVQMRVLTTAMGMATDLAKVGTSFPNIRNQRFGNIADFLHTLYKNKLNVSEAELPEVGK